MEPQVTIPAGNLTEKFGVKRARKLSNKENVPWPNPNAPSATKYKDKRFWVYVIRWWNETENVKAAVWKYGITRVGRSRRDGQLSTCGDKMGSPAAPAVCRGDWIVNDPDFKGWLKARRMEAWYFALHKQKTGKCPPGGLSCR